jgi:hypothetical protein
VQLGEGVHGGNRVSPVSEVPALAIERVPVRFGLARPDLHVARAQSSLARPG